MTRTMRDLANEIVRLQGELDREIEERRKALGWTLRNRLIEYGDVQGWHDCLRDISEASELRTGA